MEKKQVCTHQVHKVQREYVDTAGHSGQSADDGGENAETTCTEQKVLQRNMHSENVNHIEHFISWNMSYLKGRFTTFQVCLKPVPKTQHTSA